MWTDRDGEQRGMLTHWLAEMLRRNHVSRNRPSQHKETMKTPHTAAWRGKRIKVVLRDGTTFVDKFIERTMSHVFFEEHGRFKKSDIRAFIIIKGYHPRRNSK